MSLQGHPGQPSPMRAIRFSTEEATKKASPKRCFVSLKLAERTAGTSGWETKDRLPLRRRMPITMDSATRAPWLRVIDPDTKAPTPVPLDFDPERLTQARWLAGETRSKLAHKIGVSPVAVAQWEARTAAPRPDHIEALSKALAVPCTFFAVGRPHARLDASALHLRHFRQMSTIERNRAVAYTESVWELCYALEKRVRFPAVDLPGFTGGELTRAIPDDPFDAARSLRQAWGIGNGPISRVVRMIEQHGIIVATGAFDADDAATVDAFSTTHLPRPTIVLSPHRTDDVFRHRFSAAHELGHLVMHDECIPGDAVQEREADLFAAEFLTPADQITPALPKGVTLDSLAAVSQAWGVSVESLLRRAKEVGTSSNASYQRAHERCKTRRKNGSIKPESIENFPGENPALLKSAFAVADENGLGLKALAEELQFSLPQTRRLLGLKQESTTLRLVPQHPRRVQRTQGAP